MGFLILLLFIVFVVVPLGKIAFRIWEAHRQWKRATQGMRDAFNRAAGSQDNHPEPPVKKKKIDPNVGEYVAFEEIACDVKTDGSTTQTSYSRTVITESRVEDADWEDIKQ